MPEFAYSYLSTGQNLAGFDDLFYSCIAWPRNDTLQVMISGEPGSGKSTLALQASCYCRTSDEKGHPKPLSGSRHVLYYVVDDIHERIMEKIYEFGLDKILRSLRVRKGGAGDDSLRKPSRDVRPPVELGGADTIFHLIRYTGPRTVNSLDSQLLADLCELYGEPGGVSQCIVVIDGIAPVTTFRGVSRLEVLRAALPYETGMQPGRSIKPCAIFLVDEPGNAIRRDPYLTDIYITLWQGKPSEITHDGYCERYMQVHKAANCPHVRGPQTFRINKGTGIEILLSLQADAVLLHVARRKRAETCKQASVMVRFGIKTLDDNLVERIDRDLGKQHPNDTSRPPKTKGPIMRASSTLLVGPTGTMKSPMALRFCREAIRTGGKAVFISLHDKLDAIERLAEDHGLGDPGVNKCPISATEDFEQIKDSDNFVYYYIDPGFLPPEAFISRIRRLLRKMGIIKDADQPTGDANEKNKDYCLVIDAISDLHTSFPRLEEGKAFLSVLVNTLYAHGVTSLFVYNTSGEKAEDDTTNLALFDNIFRLRKRPVEGRLSTLLQVEELGNRVTGIDYIFEISSKPGDSTESILAQPSAEKYYLDKDGNLVPAGVKLYVNRTVDAHSDVNEAVCKAWGLEVPNDLNEELAAERGTSYRHILERLKTQREHAAIMAVDVAYLRQDILRQFAPLEAEPDKSSTDEEKGSTRRWSEEDLATFVPLGGNSDKTLKPCRAPSKNRSKNSLRVLPSFIDCTLVLCNLNILNVVLGVGTPGLKDIRNIIAEKLDSETPVTGMEHMPMISPVEFGTAAKEFWKQGATKGFRFFGFSKHSDPEILSCMFIEWLRTTKALQAGPISVDEAKWKKQLTDFAYCYLPPARMQLKDAQPDSCLFYHSWHSILYSNGASQLVPVKIGKGWKATKGGWCWGIVDNGMGGTKARKILEYATSEAMSAYRIIHRVGMPPRDASCHNTGELNIYNLHLMKEIFKGAWSRFSVENYVDFSPHLHAFFSEYVAFLDRLEYMFEGHEPRVSTWLDKALGSLASLLSKK